MTADWHGTIAIVGAGQLGSSLAEGLLAAGVSGCRLAVASGDPVHAQALATRLGVRAGNTAEIVAEASLVVIAVRPPQVLDVLADFADSLSPGAPVVSLAGSPDAAALAAALPAGTPIIRAMPNPAMAIREALIGWCPSPDCPTDAEAQARAVFALVGTVLDVPEARIGLIGTLGGHGQAVSYYVADAMLDWAVMQGFSRAEAHQIIAATISGAATMLRTQDVSPADQYHRLSTPGGTTVRTIAELDERAVRAAVIASMDGGRYKQ